MFSPESLEAAAETIFMTAWILLIGAFAMAAWRLWRGPGRADRVLAVDLFSSILAAASLLTAAGAPGVFALDLAIVLAVAGFIGTVAVAGALIRNAGRRSGRGVG